MSQSSGQPLETKVAPYKEQWVAFWADSDEPITSIGNIGTSIPVWDNPMSAHDWAQAQSRTHKNGYYVREVEMLLLAKRE